MSPIPQLNSPSFFGVSLFHVPIILPNRKLSLFEGFDCEMYLSIQRFTNNKKCLLVQPPQSSWLRSQ